MQEENRFFRIVWRVDAILLALAGILAIVLIAWALIGTLLRPSYAPAPEGHFRPVPKGAEENYTYRLEDEGDWSAASLPQRKILALRRWKGSPASYGLAREVLAASSAYRYTDAVNLLAIDTANSASRWLFNGYKRRIISREAIYAGGPQPPVPAFAHSGSNVPIALTFRTVDADTNKDGELDSEDVQSLYFFRPNDARAAKFFSADYILSTGETDGGDYLIVYEKGRSAFAATFHVPDFKLKSLKQLPEVPQ